MEKAPYGYVNKALHTCHAFLFFISYYSFTWNIVSCVPMLQVSCRCPLRETDMKNNHCCCLHGHRLDSPLLLIDVLRRLRF